jgi:hypothetical protein
MKKLLFRLCIVVLSLVVLLCTAQAQQDSPAKKVDQGEVPAAGISVQNTPIKPGEKLSTIWGLMGSPDRILAMRGKQDSNGDYVKMDYDANGFSLDINNSANTVQGILVTENNPSFKFINCPYKIGQQARDILAAWGEPEKTVPGTLAFWSRGVYVGVDASGGKVTYIYITYPGKVEGDGKK